MTTIAPPVTATRLFITHPGKVQLIEEELAPLDEHEVRTKSVISGISHGTELAWFRGRAAGLHKGWDPATRLYSQDLPPRAYPIAPGYETVAKVTEVGAQVTAVTPGTLVYLDRPHADRHQVDEHEAALGLIPESVRPEQAVFYPLARVALGGVHDAQITLGDTIAVTGLGVVGLLVAQLAVHAGAGRVIGVDRYPIRLAAASQLGIEVINAAEAPDVAAGIRALTGGRGADAVIEASGSYRLLHEAIRATAVAGRVATVASYHGDQRGLVLGEEYARNRITLVSSMTIGGAPHRQPGWDLARQNATARTLIADQVLTTDALITHRIPFTDADSAYELIDNAPEKTVKVVLTYAT